MESFLTVLNLNRTKRKLKQNENAVFVQPGLNFISEDLTLLLIGFILECNKNNDNFPLLFTIVLR